MIKRIIITICLAFILHGANAKVVLPTILNSNMVLQQETNARLWGSATPNTNITIKTTWSDKVFTTKSDSNGSWEQSVPTPSAGGPYEISISDGDEITLSNVLIGEVWFCSGQSNMEMPMKGFDRQPVEKSNNIITKAKSSTPIRIYTTDSKDGVWIRQFSKKPESDCFGEWLDNSPENVANASAVAYFFAQYVQEVLEVPVGIIISSWGGSSVEAWMSEDALKAFPNIDLTHLSNDEEIKHPTSTPAVLFNAKIAPLLKYNIKGFLWYQGESNRHNADQYKHLVPAFVQDLRSKWNVGEFPFYYVQIAPFKYEGVDGTSSAKLQEVQCQHMESIPNSGMVTTLDIGHPIFIHPVNKEKVGERLAYWALGATYNMKGFGYKPAIYKAMEIVDERIYIDFHNAPRGLSPLETLLDGFEIAGEDRIFYPAKAEIEGKSCRLAVSNENIKSPVAVRYAYKNYAEAALWGLDGIPIAPFRTDDW